MLSKILNVKVITNSSTNSVIKLDEDNYKIKLTISPEKGKANNLLIKLFAEYYNINKTAIEIVTGLTSNKKQLKIKLSK